MNFLKKLDQNLLTAIIILVIALIGFGCSSFLIFTDLQHIPFGFLLSGGIIAFIHLISYLLVLLDKRNGTTMFSIVSISMRLVILLGSLLLIVLMYYRWNIKLFNVFVFVGMYTVSIITFCLTFVLSKDRKEQDD